MGWLDMKVLTKSQIKQISGGASENNFDGFKFIGGFSLFSMGIGLLAQGVSYGIYDYKMPGTSSASIIGTFFKATLLSACLGAIFGGMAYLKLTDDSAENPHNSACM